MIDLALFRLRQLLEPNMRMTEIVNQPMSLS